MSTTVIVHVTYQETAPEILNNLSRSDSSDWSELGFEPREFGSNVQAFKGILSPIYPLILIIAQR